MVPIATAAVLGSIYKKGLLFARTGGPASGPDHCADTVCNYQDKLKDFVPDGKKEIVDLAEVVSFSFLHFPGQAKVRYLR